MLLHFPLPTLDQTVEAWQALETFVPHSVRSIGISNVSLPVLQVLFAASSISVKPIVVQNRFHKATDYDRELRHYCLAQGVIYQAFGILKSSKDLLDCPPVVEYSKLSQQTREISLLQLVLGLGGLSLVTGTTNQRTMRADVCAAEDVLQNHQNPNPSHCWDRLHGEFATYIEK